MISEEEIQKYKKAGELAKQVVTYAKDLIKPSMPLIEIAEKVDAKIAELGAKPAFPINLSINEVAAHSTPAPNDTDLAHGLLKVDIGIQVDGYVADTAFSLDLENSEENKKLIASAETALNKALEIINIGTPSRKIGAAIEKEIKAHGFLPVQNLSGHSLGQRELHAGITIPNTDNHQDRELKQGAYAVEPFATNGLGAVRDGKPSGIYHLKAEGNVRDPFAREVLEYIEEEYQTLPFCTRWLHKKFGSRALLALKRIEDAGLIHHYPQLIEKGKGKVAQAEHTVLLTLKEKTITTK